MKVYIYYHFLDTPCYFVCSFVYYCSLRVCSVRGVTSVKRELVWVQGLYYFIYSEKKVQGTIRKTCWVKLSLPRRVESREEMASAVSARDMAKPIREETRLAQTASSRPGHGGRGQQFVSVRSLDLAYCAAPGTSDRRVG